MPPSTRQRRRRRGPPSPAHELLADPASEVEDGSGDDAAAIAAAVNGDFSDADTGNEEGEGEGEVDEGDKAEQEDGAQESIPTTAPPIPPNLKEISSLASWTVSTSKPGCGVAQLRSPSTALFWQSDGPQPHTLNIHFFKLVGIAALRVYLDFDQDESYTPTRIAFLAGTGPHDLQEFSSLSLDQPRGWIDVDFSNVGNEESDDSDGDEEVVDGDGKAREEDKYDFYDDEDLTDEGTDEMTEEAGTADEDHEMEETGEPRTTARKRGSKGRRSRRKTKRMPILRAFLVQVKILENHQNGKDTHLRGLQIFARDKLAERAAPESGEGHQSVMEMATGMATRSGRRMLMPEWGDVPELRRESLERRLRLPSEPRKCTARDMRAFPEFGICHMSKTHFEPFEGLSEEKAVVELWWIFDSSQSDDA